MSGRKLDLVDFLVNKGISVNSTDCKRMSPLCYALCYKDWNFSDEERLRLAKLLIDMGADVNHNGKRAIDWSSQYFNFKII